jgi:16S rRNA (adenine1518-N6/adenine1519-N6)-dimethyltransferase
MLPKKSLGQHFLTNTGVVASIVDAGSVSSVDSVLEIGPGKGVLTSELLSRGAKVIAIEKDDELIPFLKEKFKKEILAKQFILIHDDILEFSVETNHQFTATVVNDYKLVANIPYYITGQIIRKFLTEKKQPSSMTLLVQKEVAERIVAKHGKESLLSLSVKAYGTPRYIKTVRAGSFTPAPKVDSAVLVIENISCGFFSNKSIEMRFFEVLHAGFAHKRKQLFGNLRAVFDENILRKKLHDCGILENARAEDLCLNDWEKLIS